MMNAKIGFARRVRIVPVFNDLFDLIRRKKIDIQNALFGIGRNRFEKLFVMTQQALNGRPFEQIGVVLRVDDQSAGILNNG